MQKMKVEYHLESSKLIDKVLRNKTYDDGARLLAHIWFLYRGNLLPPSGKISDRDKHFPKCELVFHNFFPMVSPRNQKFVFCSFCGNSHEHSHEFVIDFAASGCNKCGVHGAPMKKFVDLSIGYTDHKLQKIFLRKVNELLQARKENLE